MKRVSRKIEIDQRVFCCFLFAAALFSFIIFSPTPNYAKQLAAAVYARNLLIRYNIYDPLLRESGCCCCFSFLLYFGLIYSWCVLLLSLLKLIKGREKSKEFFNPVGKQQTKEKTFHHHHRIGNEGFSQSFN
jgi:hypothetical protein